MGHVTMENGTGFVAAWSRRPVAGGRRAAHAMLESQTQSRRPSYHGGADRP